MAKPTDKKKDQKPAKARIFTPRERGPKPDFTPKARQEESSFGKDFAELMAEQVEGNFDLFIGSLGEYAVQVGDKKMIARSFENERGIQLGCLGTNFGFSNEVFLAEGLVLSYTAEKFTPNFNLPEHTQAAQKELHSFLRAAYELTPEFASKQNQATRPSSPAKLTLVPFVPNKFAGFSREERTCSNVRMLVMGHVQVYRISDANGKYAVLSCTSQGDSNVRVVYVTLKFLQDGHELAGKLPLETMVELHKLQKENLGLPQGKFAQRKHEQGVLHAWLRKCALAAGIKDKPEHKHTKASQFGRR